MATTRKCINKIHRLMDDEDRWVKDALGLQEMAKNYFNNLFLAPNMVRLYNTLAFKQKVTMLENGSLLSPFAMDEFEVAMRQMHLDKALGSDGLNSAFYQSFGWFLVRKSLMHVFVGLRISCYPE